MENELLQELGDDIVNAAARRETVESAEEKVFEFMLIALVASPMRLFASL